MKLFPFVFLLFPLFIFSQSNTQNWSKKTIYRDINGGRPVSTVTYFDGLGRPIQQNVNKQSGTGNDIITHIEYDLGRQLKEYLSYPATSNDMSFQVGAQSATLNYSQYSGQYPFSEKILETSPLSRPLKQGSPGSDWQVNPDSDSDHTVKTVYQTNSANEVKNYFAIATWDEGEKIYNIQLQDKGYYSANQLYKTIVRDENWVSGTNNTSEEFKDKEGRVVLKRTYNDGSHDTYYVYDIYGNLTYVIPPLVSNAALQLDELCFQFKYDYRNRVVEKKVPGKQWEYLIYDKLDRVVASGLAYSPFGQTDMGYLITKYDALNRVAYTGWMQSSISRASLQQQFSNQTTNFSESRLRPGSTIDVDNVAIAYTNFGIPTTGMKLLSVNYYDDYQYPGAVAPPSSIDGQNVASSVVGHPTGKWVRVLTSASETLNEQTQIIYDLKYRIIRDSTINHLGGYTRIDSKFDFIGKVQETQTFHKLSPANNELVIKENFSYTEQDRLLVHTHQINGGSAELIAKNTYDDLGKVVSKNVGGSDVSGAIGLQKVDYRYNIRGWLTDINNDSPIGSANFQLGQGDLFGFKINYNSVTDSENGAIINTPTSVNGQVKPLYNGSIAECFWISSSDNQVRKYGYKYDPLNRLLKAFYQKPNSFVPVPHSYDEELTYDKNGNIQTLKRKGNLDSSLFTIEVDDLSYLYNGNRLIRVNDASNNPEGFQDNEYGSSVNDYGYDTLGNIVKDLNKGIDNIKYNHLNLPVEVVFKSGEKIVFLYSGVGTKLQKQVIKANGTVVIDYQDGFHYENQSLKFFPHPEGYVNVTGASYNYVFNYVDHLGNVRSSWAWSDKDGGVKVISENHYYPFGLQHKAYNNDSYVFVPMENGPGYYRAELVQAGSRTPQSSYKYKYGSKELQEDLGFNVYDYGWRRYMPDLGRWTQIDPLFNDLKFSTDNLSSDSDDIADLYLAIINDSKVGGGIFNTDNLNPFTYGYNNPLSFTDPDGRCPSCNDQGDPVSGFAGALSLVSPIDHIVGGVTFLTREVFNMYPELGNHAVNLDGTPYRGISFDMNRPGFLGGGSRGNLDTKGSTSSIKQGSRVPNPNGKKGGAAHQEKISEYESKLRDKGWDVVKERKVETKGGYKNTRFTDLTARKDGKTLNVQVGKANKNGTPVSRERKAMEDINSSTRGEKNGSNRTIFVPYNK